jgi:hypothetical protein
MKQKEIQVGKIYSGKNANSLRKVLQIIPACTDADATVRYQIIDNSKPAQSIVAKYERYASEPTLAEYMAGEKVANGVLYANISLASFATWAKAEYQIHERFAQSASMAEHYIKAVMRKGYTSLSAERVFDPINPYGPVMVEANPRLERNMMQWVYTYADGSRVGFTAPSNMCVIDTQGCPVLDQEHFLDLTQTYQHGDCAKIKAAEIQHWCRAHRPRLALAN